MRIFIYELLFFMYIYPCQISEKKRIPVLCYSSSDFPILVPFLYIVLKRQQKAYNTIRNDLVAIKAIYEFHASLGRDLDEMLIAGKFSLLIASLEQFVAWLSTSKGATNIVGRIGINAGDIDPGKRDSYLRSLKLFFEWCGQRYNGRKSEAETKLGRSLVMWQTQSRCALMPCSSLQRHVKSSTVL